MWLSSTHGHTLTKTHYSLGSSTNYAMPCRARRSGRRRDQRLGDLALSVAPLGALGGVVRVNGSEILKRAAERTRGRKFYCEGRSKRKKRWQNCRTPFSSAWTTWTGCCHMSFLRCSAWYAW